MLFTEAMLAFGGLVVEFDAPAMELRVAAEDFLMSDFPFTWDEFGFGLGFVIRLGAGSFFSFAGSFLGSDFFSNSTKSLRFLALSSSA